MIGFFNLLLTLSGIFVLLVGMLTVFSWMLPLEPPADNSNRINRIRLWWLSVKAPHIFAEHFDWMRKDERDILK